MRVLALLALLLAHAPLAHAPPPPRFACERYAVRRTARVVSEPVTLFTAADSFAAPELFPRAARNGSDYDQFLRALQHNRDAAPLPEQVELDYRIAPSPERTWQFVVTGGSSLGGASFAVQTQSGADNATLGSCTVTDHFNGTYGVACAPTATRSARLTVELQHIAFGAFVPFGPTLHVQQKLKEPLFDCAYAAPAHARDACVPGTTPLEESGGWWTAARSAAPRLHSTGWCDPPPPVSLRACVDSFSNVYMFGESHMRFTYDYLLQALGVPNGNLEVKHSDDERGSIHYYATHYITKGPEGGVMVDALRRMQFTNNSLLLVSFGSWHLHGFGVARTIRDVQTVLVPELERIMRNVSVRVVVFTGPAKFKQEGPWAGIENTASMAALLEATRLLMPPNVTVLDIVHPTRAFMESVEPAVDWDCQNDGQCSCHILCRLGGGPNVTGRFGVQIFGEIMQQACTRA